MALALSTCQVTELEAAHLVGTNHAAIFLLAVGGCIALHGCKPLFVALSGRPIPVDDLAMPVVLAVSEPGVWFDGQGEAGPAAAAASCTVQEERVAISLARVMLPSSSIDGDPASLLLRD
jgi:hypothetical protein